MSDAEALARETIAHRDAGRSDLARAGYERLLTRYRTALDTLGGLRAAAAEVGLARLDLAGDDAVGARAHFAAAEARAAEGARRFGDADWSLLVLEVAAELAALDIRQGARSAAAERVAAALDAVPVPASERGPDEDALLLGGLLYRNGSPAPGRRLLRALADSLRDREPLRAAGIHHRTGLMDDRVGDAHAAFDAYRAGLSAVGPLEGRDAELLEAELFTRAGVAADGLGEYAVAAYSYEQALERRRRHLAEDDPDLLAARYNVAELARVTGDAAFAQRELTALADHLRDAPDSDRELRILVLKNLALASLRNGDSGAAESAAVEALSLPLPAQTRGQVLRTLGSVRVARGEDPGVAADLAAIADEASREYGADSVEHLSALFGSTGVSTELEARAVYERIATTLREHTGHAERTLRGNALCVLGLNRWARDEIDGAYEAFAESVPIFEDLRAEQWRVRSALETTRPEPWPLTAPLVHLVARRLGDREEPCAVAFRQAVGSKRLQAEVVARQRELVLEGDRDLLGVHDLAARLRRSLAWTGADARRADELAALEGMLARRIPRASLAEIAARSSVSAVAASLPPDSVLVEYISLDAFADRSSPRGVSAPRTYVAFVLCEATAEKVVAVDLGAADVIDTGVDRLRRAVEPGAPTGESWRPAARALAELIWDPVAAHLTARRLITTTFVAPDGALCAVPFDALIAGDGRPLLETTTFALVATGRDIHRFDTRANWRTNDPVVIAAPEFGEPWEPFGPLTGSVGEGAAVADALGVEPIMGADATRDTVLNAADAEILHLATHGYCVTSGPVDGLSGRLTAALASHPLLGAGVALAGANRTDDTSEPGVVTALDIIGIDLAGTDLVVLSACESGLGVLDGAEGLLGLARSFLLGGARSVVWSLWRVDDAGTAALVTEFYRWLLDESPRAPALRAAKLTAYAARPDRVEVWAAFALQGDPDELVRHRPILVPPEQIYAQRAEAAGVTALDAEGRPVSLHTVDTGTGEPLRIGTVDGTNIGLAFVHDELLAGNEALRKGDAATSKRIFTEALESLAEMKYGRHLRAQLHARLGLVTVSEGDLRAAREHGIAAVDEFGRLAGSDAERSIALDNLALTEAKLGHSAEARAHLEAALALKLAAFPPGDPQIDFTRSALADLEARRS